MQMLQGHNSRLTGRNVKGGWPQKVATKKHVWNMTRIFPVGSRRWDQARLGRDRGGTGRLPTDPQPRPIVKGGWARDRKTVCPYWHQKACSLWSLLLSVLCQWGPALRDERWHLRPPSISSWPSRDLSLSVCHYSTESAMLENMHILITTRFLSDTRTQTHLAHTHKHTQTQERLTLAHIHLSSCELASLMPRTRDHYEGMVYTLYNLCYSLGL
jgi:hypothetical protein